MIKFFKRKFANFSLSEEYFLYLSATLASLFILSVLYYSYSYCLYLSEQNETIKNIAENFEPQIEDRASKKLIAYLKTIEEKNSVHFILMDESCHLLNVSNHNNISHIENACKLSLDSLKGDSLKGSSGFLNQAFDLGSIHYSYFKKLKNHSKVSSPNVSYSNECPSFVSPSNGPRSFIVFTGFDKNLLEKKIHDDVLPKLYNLLFMGSFCLIILFFFRRRIITPILNLSNSAILIAKGDTNIKVPKQSSIEMFNLAKALILVKHYIRKNENYRKKIELANDIIHSSAEARENFVKSINQELTYPLREILIYTEILSNDIGKRSGSQVDTQKMMKCVEKIREAAINIKAKTTNSLTLSYVDFSNIVKQAIQINLKSSFFKQLDIKTHIEDNIPLLYGDELKLTKILVCLISQSIENSPENKKIEVTLTSFLLDSTVHLQLVIKDQGFGLSEEELQRIQANVGWQNENSLFENMEYKFMEKFVAMHNGTFVAENKIYEGRTVTLTFPVLKEKDFRCDHEKESNVVYLHS